MILEIAVFRFVLLLVNDCDHVTSSVDVRFAQTKKQRQNNKTLKKKHFIQQFVKPFAL